MKEKPRNIGLNVPLPKKISRDKNDPFFGSIRLRGRVLTGRIVSANSARTAKIELERLSPLPKYERFEKRRTRLMVHAPESIPIEIGDKVRIVECRPISKTKNFVIVEKIK